MWSRNEVDIDLISKSMAINLNVFGPLMKCRVVCYEDDILVIIEDRHRT